MSRLAQLRPRWPWAAWALLAAPAAAEAAVQPGARELQGLAETALTAAAPALVRRSPTTAAAIPLAAGLVHDPELYAPLLWPLAALFAFLAGARTAPARPALRLFAAAAAAALPLCLLRSPDQLWGWPGALLALLGTAVLPWLLGRYRRQYAELSRTGWSLAARMEREQRDAADRARLRERARIAGDMHDDLGHHLTLLALGAGALEADPDLGPEHRAAAAELRRAAGDATARLRDVIGVLRADEQQEGPEPDRDPGVPVARARRSGLDVEAEGLDAVDGAPPLVASAVARVVQEALTNAARHAPGAAVRITAGRDGGTITLRIANGPPAEPGSRPAAGSGTGLVGLDERVRLCGGTLHAAPEPGGGFAVRAELPADGGPATEPGVTETELHRLRRGIRRRLTESVVAPLAVLAAILAVMLPVYVVSSALSVLDRDDYQRLAVGMPRPAAEQLLPPLTRDGPPDGAPRTPSGCRYYRTGFGAPDAYRVCFTDGRLASKSLVGPG